VKSGSGKPINGQKNWKITSLPICDGQLLVKLRQQIVTSWQWRHTFVKQKIIYKRGVYEI
jgi:hypothetical protein